MFISSQSGGRIQLRFDYGEIQVNKKGTSFLICQYQLKSIHMHFGHSVTTQCNPVPFRMLYLLLQSSSSRPAEPRQPPGTVLLTTPTRFPRGSMGCFSRPELDFTGFSPNHCLPFFHRLRWENPKLSKCFSLQTREHFLTISHIFEKTLSPTHLGHFIELRNR